MEFVSVYRDISGLGRKKVQAFGTLVMAFGVVTLGACDDGSLGPESVGSIQVLLTDAPTDMLSSADVWISQVYLVGRGESGEPDIEEAAPDEAAPDESVTGRVDLFNDPANPLVFDLLQLQNGVTADLTGLVSVDPTSYRGLRFVVDSARVTLAEGLTFESGETQAVLRVPSGSTSGIKVKIADVLDVAEDETLTVVVDLDVDENFVIHTNPQTGDVRSVLFKPVLRESRRTRQR
jgi:hypothetical protein